MTGAVSPVSVRLRRMQKRAVGADPFAWWLTGVVSVCVAARLGWLSLVFDVTTKGSTDQADYVRIGHAWASGNFSTGLLRTPLYPAILAVAEQGLQIGGLDVPLRVPIGLMQVVLAGLAVGAVGALTKRLTHSRAAGVVAATLLAVWPNQVVGVGAVMSELVATPLLVAATACAMWEPPEKQTLRLRLVAAFLSALALLTRPSLLLSTIVILAMTLRGPLPRKARLRNLTSQLGVILLVLSPWLVVSSFKEGRPSIQLSSAGGFNLCLGNNPLANGTYVVPAANGRCALRPIVRGELAEADRLGREGVTWAIENPGRQPYLLRQRAYWTFYMDGYWLDWYPNWVTYEGPWTHADLRHVTQLWWRWIIFASLAGFIAGAVRWRAASLWLAAVAVSTVMLPLITIGDPRFHDPMVPFMAAFSGMAVATLLAAVRTIGQWKTSGPPVAAESSLESSATAPLDSGRTLGP